MAKKGKALTQAERSRLHELEAIVLWRHERRALVDDAAARECARRFADRTGYTQLNPATGRCTLTTFGRRAEASYLAGLRGERNEYAHGRGGNFTRPLWSAYGAGERLRNILLADAHPVKEG